MFPRYPIFNHSVPLRDTIGSSFHHCQGESAPVAVRGFSLRSGTYLEAGFPGGRTARGDGRLRMQIRMLEDKPHMPHTAPGPAGRLCRSCGGAWAAAAGGWRRGRDGSRPVSRVLSWTAIHLGRASPRASSDLPGSRVRAARRAAGRPMLPYSVLLRVGFTVPSLLPATRCALTAPFHPCRHCNRSAWAVCFLWHFPWARAPQALPGTLPCGARTFLRGAGAAAAVRPTPEAQA